MGSLGVQNFLLWTIVYDLEEEPTWHSGKVVREIPASRQEKFTHDAMLDGTSDVRGVPLFDLCLQVYTQTGIGIA